MLWFLHSGSNSFAASNLNIDIHDLSWEYVSRSSSHYISMDAASCTQTLLYEL